jgi:hypothetical protein
MQFNFENAFMHFARTGAPRGFVWKLVLSYIAGGIAFGCLMMALMGGWYVNLLSAYASKDTAEIMAASQMSGGMVAFVYFVLMPLGLFFYAIFEASYLRRYIRQDRFFLRVGRDEWNVFVVLLIWFGGFAVITFAIGIIIGLIAAIGAFAFDSGGEPSLGAIYGMVVFIYLVIFGAMAFFGVKFSPAAAMTIRDRKIRFASAWGATKGKFWPLLGAYALWALLGLVGYMVAMTALVTVGAGAFAAIDPESTNPFGVIAGLGPLVVILYFLILAAGVCFYYIWAGPAALAAKTDPRYLLASPDVDAPDWE